MKVKNNYLFVDSQITKRKTLGQQEFEKDFLEVLQYSEYCMKEALKMMHNERELQPLRYRNRNWTATVMNGFITGLLTDKYPEKMKLNQGVLRFVSDKAIIIFKKLSNKYHPSNIHTQKVGRERNQLSAFGELNVPIIYVGYISNETYDEIEGCYAVCLDNWNLIEWISDLSGISDYSTTSTTTLPTHDQEEQVERKLVSVKEKSAKRAK